MSSTVHTESTSRTLQGLAASAGALDREEGQTMAEYGVVLAVITPFIIAAIALLSGNVSNAIGAVTGILPG